LAAILGCRSLAVGPWLDAKPAFAYIFTARRSFEDGLLPASTKISIRREGLNALSQHL
jgi:hypothetical protein